MKINTIICGDSLTELKKLPDESIDCCITSPPYWGLRDYGVSGQLGLEKTPEEYVAKMVEVFREVKRVLKKEGNCWLNLGDSYCSTREMGTSDNGMGSSSLTNAYGTYDNERRKDFDFGRSGKTSCVGEKLNSVKGRGKVVEGLKPKDLVGIPWRVAFALQQPYYNGRIKNEKDRLWLAAIIDGEGCLFIHKRKIGQSNGQGYERKSNTYSPGLEVSNTHESIIKKCQEITGLGSICSQEKDRNLKLYRWNVRSNESRNIAKEIYPYLVGKKQEARLLLGCPSSGEEAEKAHESLIALHNGKEATIDFNEPESMYERGWYLRQDLIWMKPNPMPESVTDRCTKSHEYIFLLTKSPKYYFDNEAIKEPTITNDNSNRDRDNSKLNNTPGRTKMAGLKTNSYEMRNRRSVWTITTKPFKEAHFATFPEDLITPMILAGCPKEGLVLDPFMGAGTTGVVAKKLGRNYIGLELNQKYVDMAESRISSISRPLF